jgi:type I restriction enzyme S subunit
MQRILPKGWEWKMLGESGKIFSGSTPSTSNPEYFDGEIPWITPADLSNFDGIYIERGKKNITELGLKSSSVQLLPKDTILFSSRAPIGYVAIAANPVTTNQGFKNLVLKEGIDPKYVFYYLKTHKREMQQFGSGSTFLEVSAARFAKIPIIIPPLPIQHQIVAVLEQAEAVKRQRQEADAQTGALLQSVFFEMFGNPVTNERGWPLHKMKNVCKKITDGTHDTPEPTSSGVPFIMGKHIRDRIIDFPNSLFVSKNVHDEIYRRCNPQQGDVILVHIGANLGNAVCINVPFEFSMKNIALLKPNPSLINGKYLESYLIFTKQNTKKTVSRGGAQQFMSIKEMELIPCLLPPLTLQEQFAQIVESVERIRDQQVASGRQIEGLCEGLMQRAFAGELVA